jgi:hypothetical protein
MTEMVKKKEEHHEKLSDEIIEQVNFALSAYLGDDIVVHDESSDREEDWQFKVRTQWMSKNCGIFNHVISKYYIDADVIKHHFEDKEDYRNGRVYRIYPHISWNHFNGGSNGHNMEPEMIIIEKDVVTNKWSSNLKLV